MKRSDGPGLLPPRLLILAALALLFSMWPRVVAAAPEGEMRWAVHISLAPTYFEPAETPGIITPFMVLYALHDALVKPMPGQPQAPSLAESWSVSPDGTAYEFVLRRGVRFHNGDPLTADDVKLSFERYRGSGHKLLKESIDGTKALLTERPFSAVPPRVIGPCRPPQVRRAPEADRQSVVGRSRRH